MTAAGAAALSRWSLGTVSFGGYLVAPLFSLAIAPILYVIIKTWADKFPGSDVSKNKLEKTGLNRRKSIPTAS